MFLSPLLLLLTLLLPMLFLHLAFHESKLLLWSLLLLVPIVAYIPFANNISTGSGASAIVGIPRYSSSLLCSCCTCSCCSSYSCYFIPVVPAMARILSVVAFPADVDVTSANGVSNVSSVPVIAGLTAVASFATVANILFATFDFTSYSDPDPLLIFQFSLCCCHSRCYRFFLMLRTCSSCYV